MISVKGCVVGLFRLIGRRFSRIAQRLELGARVAAYDRWVRDRGDITLRLEYVLGPDSVVWDVGGYEGQWASDIFSRFGCHIEVFEPVRHAAEFIRHRFVANQRVRIHPYALGVADYREELELAADESSLERVHRGASTEAVSVRDVIVVMKEIGGRVDLLKLNIEGGEFALMERLLSSGLISQISELQIQFHDFVPNARARREKITKALALTHEQTWCYEFVWENWRRRPTHA